MSLEVLALRLLALPQCIVRVLDVEHREPRRPPVYLRVIELLQLAKEDRHRPATFADDVVHGNHEHVLVRGRSQERAAKQRPVLEVERRRCLGAYRERDRLVVCGGGAHSQIAPRHVHEERGRHDLDGRSLLGGKRGTERLLARDQCIDAPLERHVVERSLETERFHDVVRRAGRIELVHEPEPLLGE